MLLQCRPAHRSGIDAFIGRRLALIDPDGSQS
jgi:hypothetical protein